MQLLASQRRINSTRESNLNGAGPYENLIPQRDAFTSATVKKKPSWVGVNPFKNDFKVNSDLRRDTLINGFAV